MRTYEESLGVGCNFCHLRNSASDDSKPEKRVARKMILMTAAINQQNFDGESRVTCYTCHRGNAKPETSVPEPPASHGEAYLMLPARPSPNPR
jgi:photosynthetic reaction center cytochrome c subunit